MKSILFLRHGKSDWQAEFNRDHERPLARRGQNSAATMGTFLAKTGQIPERAFTSSAVRAHDTVVRAAKAGEWTCDIETRSELYEASAEEVLDFIRQADDADTTILLAGHEPTWSEVTGMLVGDANIRFPTAAIARVDVAVTSWTEIEFGRGTLVWFVPPRLLVALSRGE